MTALDDLSAALRSATDTVGACVVGVNRIGSGLVISEGLVLTNAHNLRGEQLFVSMARGEERPASLRAADPDEDLAVLEADAGTPVTAWSDQPVSIGQVVIALGARTSGEIRPTAGTVSAVSRSFRGPRGRRIAGGFEHTSPLGRGSSGGPVLDLSGAVVGLNTHRLGEGFYLALPTDAALRRRVESLAAGRTPRHRRLGAAVAPPRAARHLRAAAGLPEVDGVLVRAVEEGSPAERAGLKRGDVLVSADGSPLRSVDDLHAALAKDGPALELAVVRATEELTVRVEFPGS